MAKGNAGRGGKGSCGGTRKRDGSGKGKGNKGQLTVGTSYYLYIDGVAQSLNTNSSPYRAPGGLGKSLRIAGGTRKRDGSGKGKGNKGTPRQPKK
jgi:hypothetical protein